MSLPRLFALRLILRVAVIVVGLTWAGWVSARSDFVVISSRAAPDYEREQADGSLRPESYVFMPGQNLGFTRDGSTEASEFQPLLESLAHALAKREFWPAAEPTEADLLIVVHWGETEVYEDPMREIVMDSLNQELSEFNRTIATFGIADPGRINELKAAQSMAQESVLDSARRNAELLGYREAMMKAEQSTFPGVDEFTMKSELAEPRYFVVLTAWDYAAMRRGERPRLLWLSRMSTRAAGINFRAARELLIAQAGPSLGEQVDGLVRVRVKSRFGRAEVEIGESKVVEEAPAISP